MATSTNIFQELSFVPLSEQRMNDIASIIVF